MAGTNTKELLYCPQHGYPLPCNKCGLGELEIGIQQGRQEVCDWFYNHPEILGEHFNEFCKQVREWGITYP